MVLQIVFVLFVIALYGGTYFLTWHEKREHLGRYKYLLLVLFLLSVALAFYGMYRQDASSREAKAQNQTLRSQVTNLEGKQKQLLDDNRTLAGKLDDLMAKSDTILAALRTTKGTVGTVLIVPKAPTRLIELTERRRSWRDTSGNFHLVLIFRSRDATPLRDINIKLEYESPVSNVEAVITGAFVIEQGTQKKPVKDRRYEYYTGYLSQSNDIVIETIGKDTVKVRNIQVSP